MVEFLSRFVGARNLWDGLVRIESPSHLILGGGKHLKLSHANAKPFLAIASHLRATHDGVVGSGEGLRVPCLGLAMRGQSCN